jgi:hypothetical protein
MNHATLNLLEGLVNAVSLLLDERPANDDERPPATRGMDLKGMLQSVKTEVAREAEQVHELAIKVGNAEPETDEPEGDQES